MKRSFEYDANTYTPPTHLRRVESRGTAPLEAAPAEAAPLDPTCAGYFAHTLFAFEPPTGDHSDCGCGGHPVECALNLAIHQAADLAMRAQTEDGREVAGLDEDEDGRDTYRELTWGLYQIFHEVFGCNSGIIGIPLFDEARALAANRELEWRRACGFFGPQSEQAVIALRLLLAAADCCDYELPPDCLISLPPECGGNPGLLLGTLGWEGVPHSPFLPRAKLEELANQRWGYYIRGALSGRGDAPWMTPIERWAIEQVVLSHSTTPLPSPVIDKVRAWSQMINARLRG